ncbi:MAG TPA: Lin1244/Lin1753 domain-containing protein [Flavipsychrobacter sp.]
MSIKYKFWFPHSSNPLEHRGLNSMFRKYKAQGYGMWWRLNEILATQPDYKMDITNEEVFHELADDMRCDVETLLSFIDDCVNNYKLLKKSAINIWSPLLVTDMKPLEEKRNIQKEAGKRGGVASGKARRKQLSEGSTLEGNLQPNLEPTPEAVVRKNEAEKSREEQSRVDDSKEEKENLPTPEVVETVVAEPTPTAPYLPFATLEQLRDRALADEFHFTALYVAQKQVPDADTLRQWLDAFHRWLRYCGEHVKNEKDYRTHFKNWFAKQDKKTPPARYDPVPRAINLPAAKSAQELLAEQSMTPDQVRNCFKNAS